MGATVYVTLALTCKFLHGFGNCGFLMAWAVNKHGAGKHQWNVSMMDVLEFNHVSVQSWFLSSVLTKRLMADQLLCPDFIWCYRVHHQTIHSFTSVTHLWDSHRTEKANQNSHFRPGRLLHRINFAQNLHLHPCPKGVDSSTAGDLFPHADRVYCQLHREHCQ